LLKVISFQALLVLCGAPSSNELIPSFGQRILSLRHHLFVQPAGASPRRTTISSFGWRILIATPPSLQLAGTSPLTRRPIIFWLALLCRPIIFWPAHPITASPLPILAGAYDHLFWPAHPIATATYHILAGASNCCAAIAYLGWRIRLPILAGASRRPATLSYFGRRIAVPPYHIWLALPRHPIIFRLAHPIAAPPLPSILVGASDRLFRPVHPITAPTYHILAGASNRRATIAYLGWRI
jgi:hypothetical protein